MTLMIVLLILPLVTACVLWALYSDPKYTRIMILMLLANIATIYQIVQYKRVANLFRRHHGKICGNCLFPLEGLDDEGVCPECGHSYEIEKTIQGWQQDLNVRDPREDFSPSHDFDR